MQNYIVRRLLLVFPTLFLISVIVFGLIRLVPGDAVDLMADQRGAMFDMDVEAIRDSLGLADQIHIAYFKWVGAMVRGDFGESLWSHRSAISELKRRYPVTLELAVLTIVFSTIWGLSVGVLTAIRQDKLSDYFFRTVAIIGLSVPYFWTSILVLVFASIYLDWSPDPIYHPLTEDPLGNMKQMIVPALIFAFYVGAPIARMTRAMMLEVLRQDYIRTARAKGLTERVIISRHSLKNAFIAVITIIGLQAAWSISGIVIIESVWGLPGVGKYMLDIIVDRDYPMLQAMVIFLAFFVILINLTVDISYGWLNPRIRYR
jgi:peptide/nickel transport system permease protein